MKFLYHLFIALYPIVAKLIAFKNQKAKLWIDGRKDIFIRLDKAFFTNSNKIIWVHCSSLGEFEQGRPIIEKLKEDFSYCKIIITFFSPSGFETKKDYALADWIFYLPMDSQANAKRFYDIVNPSLVIFVKYEFWHYYLQEANLRKIPLLLVSGIFRPNQPFFKKYGGFNRQSLGYFTWFFLQNEASLNLLRSINITNNVTLSGDTRYDRVMTIANQFQPIRLIESFLGETKKVIVAGSTWQEDDEALHHYVINHPEIKFIIAPHDIQKSRIDDFMKLYPNAIRFSDLQGYGSLTADSEESTKNVLLIDNIGMLSRSYHYATICYIGGGFGEDGVHNVLEAAVYSKPVVFGPEYSKYIEAIGLVGSKGGYSGEDALHLEKIFDNQFNNNDIYLESSMAAGEFVRNNAGATNIIMEWIKKNFK